MDPWVELACKQEPRDRQANPRVDFNRHLEPVLDLPFSNDGDEWCRDRVRGAVRSDFTLVFCIRIVSVVDDLRCGAR